MLRMLAIAGIAPLFMLTMFGLAEELVDMSHDVSFKSVEYAQQMHDALPCALEGRLLEECSPDLYSVSFDKEIASFEELNQRIIDESNRLLEEQKLSE